MVNNQKDIPNTISSHTLIIQNNLSVHNAVNTRSMQLTVNISNNVNINIAHRILSTTDRNRTSFHLHTNVQTNNVQQNEDESDEEYDDADTDDTQNSADDDDDDDDQQLTPTKNKGSNAQQVG